MIGYSLRLLDPAADAELFREAYSWRARPKTHAQPDRMSFEEFASVRDDQITVGLFNGQLAAVYFLHETEPGNFQAHFTSQRGIPRTVLLAGAAQVAQDFFAAGAKEIHAWVTERNTPLKSFLTQLGFGCVGQTQLCCVRTEFRTTMSPNRNQRSFVKYSLKANADRTFRQKADFHDEPVLVR